MRKQLNVIKFWCAPLYLYPKQRKEIFPQECQNQFGKSCSPQLSIPQDKLLRTHKRTRAQAQQLIYSVTTKTAHRTQYIRFFLYAKHTHTSVLTHACALIAPTASSSCPPPPLGRGEGEGSCPGLFRAIVFASHYIWQTVWKCLGRGDLDTDILKLKNCNCVLLLNLKDWILSTEKLCIYQANLTFCSLDDRLYNVWNWIFINVLENH